MRTPRRQKLANTTSVTVVDRPLQLWVRLYAITFVALGALLMYSLDTMFARLDRIEERQEQLHEELLSRKPIPVPEVLTQILKPTDLGAHYRVTMTAYASEVWQTCGSWCTGPDDPFITATGNWVQPGTVAVSRDLLGTSLPYGTRLKILSIDPSHGCRAWLPGTQGILPDVLVVDDTMHERKRQQVDVWMPVNQLAVNWGRCSGTVAVVL